MKGPPRLGLWIPWGLFALVVLGWTLYWNTLAHLAQTRLEAAFAAERAAGADLRVATIRREGFPLQCAFELRDIAYTPADGAFRASTPRLVLHVNVLNPQHVIIAAPAPLTIARRNSTLAISGTNMLLSVRTANNTLARASFEADTLTIRNTAKPAGTTFGRTLLHLRPDPRTAGAYQLAAQFENIALATPVKAFDGLGATIASADAAIVIEQGAALFNAPRGDALGPWAAAGGQARLEGFGIGWGAAHGSGQGALSIDAQRRLQGTLTLRLDNPPATFNALAQSATLPRDAKQALQVAALGYALSGSAIQIPLRAADGTLYVGPVRVRDLAPLYTPR